MKNILDRLARLEARRRSSAPAPASELSAEVRALVAATPLQAGERAQLLRDTLARVDVGSATAADLALLAECSLGTLRIAWRLEASV